MTRSCAWQAGVRELRGVPPGGAAPDGPGTRLPGECGEAVLVCLYCEKGA